MLELWSLRWLPIYHRSKSSVSTPGTKESWLLVSGTKWRLHLWGIIKMKVSYLVICINNICFQLMSTHIHFETLAIFKFRNVNYTHSEALTLLCSHSPIHLWNHFWFHQADVSLPLRRYLPSHVSRLPTTSDMISVVMSTVILVVSCEWGHFASDLLWLTYFSPRACIPLPLSWG